jgi:DNA-binding NarL/FixJ family response regulator
MAIRIAIVEDDKETREGLKDMIDFSPALSCVGVFENAELLTEQFRHLSVDIVLMDINLPGESGIECVEELKKVKPGVQFLMCTHLDNDDAIYDALCAGATGYLLKNISQKELEAAIKSMHEGGSPMSPPVARKIVNSFSGRRKNMHLFNALTDTEKEVLKLLDKGYPYKIIADKLKIGIETVRWHIRNIYEKLHVHSRTDALNKIFPKTLI